MEREEQKGDREIWIGILPQYRQNGIASYVLKTVIHNIFSSDLNCQDIHLSIDKENIASIHLALHCGFIENKELEQELQEDNDNRTRIFTIHNYVDTIQESQKSFVKRMEYHSNTKKTVSNDIKSI